MNKLFKGLLVGVFSVPCIVLLSALFSALSALKVPDLSWELKELLGATPLGLIWGLFVGLLGVLLTGVTVGAIGTISSPNEGIKRSVRNALISGLGSGLLIGLGSGLLRWDILFVGKEDGLVVGMIIGLRFGGRAFLQHCALRLILWYNNYAPLHYIHFLDYATARIFLLKVGGGYMFVHRMLLEYFAAMHQTSAERQSCNING
jgi:hypothetical protein